MIGRSLELPMVLRVCLAAALVMTGVYSAKMPVSLAMRAADPQAAFNYDPNSPQLRATLAERLMAKNDAADRRRAVTMATSAYRGDPSSASALATIGLASQIDGRPAMARQLFALSQRLSRRNLATQLWFIENAVAAGDIGGALRHYDLALRTSRAAPDLLFPVLAAAASEAPVRKAIVGLIAVEPNWAHDFLVYLAESAPDVAVAGRLIAEAQRNRVTITDGILALIVDRLVAIGDYATAWTLFAGSSRQTGRESLRDGSFRAALSLPSAFDWRLTNDPRISTSIRNEGGLDFTVAGAGDGIIARQLLMLPAGRYLLATVGETTPALQPPLRWRIVCVSGDTIAHIAINDRRQVGFNVSPECRAQWIELPASAGEGAAQIAGVVQSVSILSRGPPGS